MQNKKVLAVNHCLLQQHCMFNKQIWDQLCTVALIVHMYLFMQLDSVALRVILWEANSGKNSVFQGEVNW